MITMRAHITHEKTKQQMPGSTFPRLVTQPISENRRRIIYYCGTAVTIRNFRVSLPNRLLLEWILQNMVRKFVTHKQVQADKRHPI